MTGVGVVPKAYPGEQFSQCEWWSTMSGFLAMIFIFVLVSIVLGVTRSNRPSLGDGGYPPNQWSQKVMDLITASNSPVIAVLDGHLHFLYSGSASSLAPQYVTDAAYKGRALMLTIRPQ